MYGGAAPNPFVSLAQILAKLKDENGHILSQAFTTTSFASSEELAAWKSLPFDEEDTGSKEVGSKTLVEKRATACWSAPGTAYARRTRHSRRFHGSGCEDGDPAKATAKVSMRLVPGMTPPKRLSYTRATWRRSRRRELMWQSD